MLKGNFSGQELVNSVVEVLGDDVIEQLVAPSTKVTPVEEKVKDFGDDDRPKILVVDDNVWDARLMRRLLESRQRFSVLEAHSAENAWELLKKQPPNLIILDLMLPDEQGESVLKRIYENGEVSQVPVIIVSAKEIEPETRADLTIYADSIWSKTMLDRNSLLSHIENLLTV